ncbi:unnamed protein product, partial [Notodromas monacha]
ISKFLDQAGGKLDYRRYGETLFDILIAGGILAPGGSLVQDADANKPVSTKICLFHQNEDTDSIRSFAQVFVKLMRRYKYLEKMFEEEMKKILVFLKGFEDAQRHRLAKATAFWLASSTLPPTCLINLLQEHLVKDGIALEFLLEVVCTWKQEKDITSLKNALKKAGIDNRLMEFFPPNKRSTDYFKSVFEEKGLLEIVAFHNLQAHTETKKLMQKELDRMIKDEEAPKQLTTYIKDTMGKCNLEDKDVVTILWNAVMGSVEWNKKEELVAEQAFKHLKHYAPMFADFTGNNAKAELALLIKIQEYCYDNMSFMKTFHKIVLLLYKTDVLSENVILHWYREAHSPKGKSVFLEQTKRLVEWLQNAEEESEDEEDDDE